MAVISSLLRIIKNSLIRSRDREDITQDKSGFSGRDAHGYVESKSQAKSIKRVPDIEDGRSFIRSRESQLIVGKTIIPVLISKFKLRGFNFGK